MSTSGDKAPRQPRWDTWANSLLLVLFIFFIVNLVQLAAENYAGRAGQLHPVFLGILAIGGLALLGMLVVLTIAAFRAPRSAWRYASSLRLGITLLASVLVATVFGTLVVQKAADHEYIDAYSREVAGFLKAAHLTDVYGSWWFAALLGALVVNTLACVIDRKPWSLPKLGFLSAHLGMVVLLAGALIGNAARVEGVLVLEAAGRPGSIADEGLQNTTAYAASNEYAESTYRNIGMMSGTEQELLLARAQMLLPANIPEEHRIPLGTTIKLEKFEELHYDEPFVVSVMHHATRVDTQTGQSQAVSVPEYQIEYDNTRPVRLAESLGEIRISKVYKHFRRSTTLEAAADGSPYASITATSEAQRRELLLGEESLQGDSFNLHVAWGNPTEARLKEWRIEPGVSPIYIFAFVGSNDPLTLRLREGEEKRIEGTEFRVKLKRFFHDIKVRRDAEGRTEVVDGSDVLRQAAVQLEITGPDGGTVETTIPNGSRMVHSHEMSAAMQEIGLDFLFRLDGALEDLVLTNAAGESGSSRPVLEVYRWGEEVETVDFPPGSDFRPYLSKYTLHLRRFLERARPKVEIYNDSREPNPAVEVEWRRGGRAQTTLLECRSLAPLEETMTERERFVLSLDEKRSVVLQLRSDYVRDWISHVTFQDGDGRAQAHAIEVNRPLIHKGFYYYQTNWQPKTSYGEAPERWYTELTVKSDPGLWIVYVGLALIVFGIIYALYVRPRLPGGSRKEVDYVE